MVICQMSLRLRKSSTAGYHPAAAAGAQGAADLTWLEHRREKQALQAVLLREGLCRCHVAAAVQLRQLAAFARWREALGCQDRRLLRARSAWATAAARQRRARRHAAHAVGLRRGLHVAAQRLLRGTVAATPSAPGGGWLRRLGAEEKDGGRALGAPTQRRGGGTLLGALESRSWLVRAAYVLSLNDFACRLRGREGRKSLD